MDEWLKALERLGHLLLGNPADGLEMGVVLVVSVLVFLLVLNKAGSAFAISNTGMWYALVVGVLGVALVMITMVAASFYLPLWETESLRVWILVGVGLLASLLLVIPLMCAIQRTGYIGALLTWFTAVASFAIMVVLIGLVFEGFAAGARSADRGVERRKELESFTK